MTEPQRRTYSRKFQSLQKKIEKKYFQAVYSALKQYAGEIVASNDGTLHLLNPYIGPVIKRIYKTAGLEQAKSTRQGLMKLKASFGTNDELVNAILDYLNKYLLDKSVRNISETTRNWVLEQISEGVKEGKGAQQIAREIVGADCLKFQALRVVRTETARATNVGAVAAMNASPYETQKEWISAHDNRTRHSHKNLDGQIREMAEDFKPGLGQPGDPRAEAKETINCRCTIAAVPKRDSQGRLIRKPVQMNPLTPNRLLQAV